MKFNVHYRTLYARLHPNSPRGIRCARFLHVWRTGCKVIEAPSYAEAECYFIRDTRWKGKEREIVHIRALTPAMLYKPRRRAA